MWVVLLDGVPGVRGARHFEAGRPKRARIPS